MKLSTFIASLASIAFLASVSFSADWPEWRGPERSGVVSGGPSLLKSFTREGPKKLWENTEVPGARSTGWSSVSVADGRAYCFLNWKTAVPITERTLTERALRGLGWSSRKMPPDILKAVEAARVSPERKGLRHWNEIKKFAQDWIEANLSEEQRRLRGPVYDRLIRGDRALPFEVLDKLEPVKDREFENQEALDKWLAQSGIEGDVKANVVRGIPSTKDVAKDVVVCVDAATGEIQWKKEFAGRAHGHPCSSTPTIAGGRCFVLGSDANVYCLDAKTGEEVWNSKTKQNPGSNDASSFAVIDGVAVLTSGPLTGFDAQTGEVLWSERQINGNHNSAAYWKAGGKTYLICNSNGNLGCIEPKTGKVLWTVRGGGWSSAAVEGDVMAVFSSRPDVGLSAFKLTLTGAEKLWTVEATDRGASPVISNGCVFAFGGRGSGHGLCVDLKTGEVKWDQKVPGTVEISSPIAADGKIIAVVGSALCMLEATPDEYRELGRAELRIETCTSPALVDGKLYLRLQNGIACYDLSAL